MKMITNITQDNFSVWNVVRQLFKRLSVVLFDDWSHPGLTTMHAYWVTTKV